MKKLISLVLVLLMLCSIGTGAFAEGITNAIDNNPDGSRISVEAGGSVKENDGTVEVNNGTVETNNGTVTTNDSWVTTNNGTVETNNKTVYKNNGTVKNNNDGIYSNESGAVVEANGEDGKIINNKAGGTVTANSGEVTANYGTVTTNSGTVGENNGTVTTNNSWVTTNCGTIGTNNDYVGNNESGAVVEINGADGTIADNKEGGTVDVNEGTVTANEGTVTENKGTVEENSGTVKTNSAGGTVTNKEGGSVEENYGTVIGAEGETSYGVVVNDTDGKGGSRLMQFFKGVANKLADLFTRDDYELKGYKEGDSADGVEADEYTADAPGIITLLWEKIVPPEKDPDPEEEPEPEPEKDPEPEVIQAVKPYSLGDAAGSTIKLIYDSRSGVVVTEDKVSKVSITVDGTKITEDDFSLKFDSRTFDIEITFSEKYLATLSAGSHTVRIVLLGYVYTATVTV